MAGTKLDAGVPLPVVGYSVGMSDAAHWDSVYSARAPEALTWYQETPHTSLRLIEEAGLPPTAQLLDAGAGASTLVDLLLERGYEAITAVDLSAEALAKSRARLGAAADRVQWIVGDLRAPLPLPEVSLWHDRAVFHFLIEADDRQAYLEQLKSRLRPGGGLVLSTFAADGPERCSGLPAQRYSEASLVEALGPSFRLEEALTETHPTPAGATQRFLYARFTFCP